MSGFSLTSVVVHLQSLKSKLLLAFLVLGIVPMAAVGMLSYYRAYDFLQERSGRRMQSMSVDVAGKIDRSLSERYDDVQDFAFNAIERNSPSKLTDAANFYTQSYGCYDLMVVTDGKGKVVACNTVAFDGRPLDTNTLVGKNVQGQMWYESCINGRIPSGHSYFSEVSEDPDTLAVCGQSGPTIIFAAPVRNTEGDIVGVWSTRASVTRILGQITAEQAAAQVAEGIVFEQQVMTKSGLVLSDRDPQAIMKLNLIDAGVQAAGLGAKGESGFLEEPHSDRHNDQINGYAATKGYCDFPGLGWVVLSRLDSADATQSASMFRNVVVLVGGFGTIVILFLGHWFTDRIVRPVRATVASMNSLANGDLSCELPTRGSDELAGMCGSFNAALKKIRAAVDSNTVDWTQISVQREEMTEANSKFEAIGHSQAVIEFDMDGTVIMANDYILNILGYSVEEVVGQQQSLFGEMSNYNSSAYRDFWAKLNRGEYVAGEFKQVGTGGRIVWLQASFNPIADGNGNLVKVVQYGTDVTAQVKSRNEMSEILRLVNSNAEMLSGSAEELTAVSRQMAANSHETSSQALLVSNSADQVRRIVETVTTGVEEMNVATFEIAKNACDAARVSQEAVATAATADKTIAKLDESSVEIGKVVKVITSIAEQTNLLALNATIEAARAGEAGKGFGVVANEVKELAKETAKATEDISRKVETIQGDTQGAVLSIREIGMVIAQINDISNTIAGAVEQQTATANEMGRGVSEATRSVAAISQNIEAVTNAAQDANQGAADCEHAASELSRMANELMQLGAKNAVHERGSAAAFLLLEEAGPGRQPDRDIGCVSCLETPELAGSGV